MATAEIQRRLAAQDKVRFRMHAMGTSLERRDRPEQTLEDKVRSVEDRLAE